MKWQAMPMYFVLACRRELCARKIVERLSPNRVVGDN